MPTIVIVMNPYMCIFMQNVLPDSDNVRMWPEGGDPGYLPVPYPSICRASFWRTLAAQPYPAKKLRNNFSKSAGKKKKKKKVNEQSEDQTGSNRSMHPARAPFGGWIIVIHHHYDVRGSRCACVHNGIPIKLPCLRAVCILVATPLILWLHLVDVLWPSIIVLSWTCNIPWLYSALVPRVLQTL